MINQNIASSLLVIFAFIGVCFTLFRLLSLIELGFKGEHKK